MIEKLEALLENGQDSAGLRFALANGYFGKGDALCAIEHARAATELDPNYSAAWRLLGQAQVKAGRLGDATETFLKGIEVAKLKGDRQVEKEMRVFLKRAQQAVSQIDPV